VTAESGQGWFEADALRRLVPIVALAVALVAVVTQPSTFPDLLLACLPVVAFTIWAYVPATPLLALTIAVIVPVVIAQRSGELEPLMFEASLLAFVVGLWSPSLKSAVPLGVLAAASPVLVAQVQEPAEVAVAIWIMGIAFPWSCRELSFARSASPISSRRRGASWRRVRWSPSGERSHVTFTTSSATGWRPSCSR
jgi:hypothetical protein